MNFDWTTKMYFICPFDLHNAPKSTCRFLRITRKPEKSGNIQIPVEKLLKTSETQEVWKIRAKKFFEKNELQRVYSR